MQLRRVLVRLPGQSLPAGTGAAELPGSAGARAALSAGGVAGNFIMRWKLLWWNVNGLRAAEKKGFGDWLGQTGADIVAVQETKARPEQLSEALLNPPGYRAYWSAAKKKGYSGVGTYSRLRPLAVATGLDDPRFDPEGRVLISEFEPFVFLKIFVSNM